MSVPAVVQEKQQSNLLELDSGRKAGAMIVFLYGVEGIGKSSFAKDAGAKVIDLERGTRELDIDRIKEPDEGWTWLSVQGRLQALLTSNHNIRRVGIDTLGALETLIWKFICVRDSKANIEEYGFGKGYVAALDIWKVFVSLIEQLKIRRGIDMFLVGHSQVKTFKNPEGEDFDRYSPSLHDKAAGLLKERSDVVLFANYEQFAKKRNAGDKMEKAKGVSTDRHLIFTRRTAAYDAKNRYDLPASMELDWRAFEDAVKANAAATPAQLRALIAEKAIGFTDEKLRVDVAAAIARAGDDAQKLRQLSNWTTDKLAELAAAAQQ